MGICAYRHVTLENDENITAVLNKEIEQLKEEVKDLRANIKIKQEQPNKADFEASKMTEIMLKEKRDMEQHVEDIKKSCAKAIELKKY